VYRQFMRTPAASRTDSVLKSTVGEPVERHSNHTGRRIASKKDDAAREVNESRRREWAHAEMAEGA
jgi:hypothetical protein